MAIKQYCAPSLSLRNNYGLDKIMEPLIRDLNVLATTGVSVYINGVERRYKGALLTF